MNRQRFLAKYNISEQDFEKAGISWGRLMEIYHHYLALRPDLETILTLLAEYLRKADKVHTVKARTKEPEHLLEKIIRKRLACPQTEITADNYQEIITDLVGIRIMHLFKEDWVRIHDFITENWEQVETPIANVRHGDKAKLIEGFRNKGLDIVEHPYGYRSLHYLIVSRPAKGYYVAEIQVRTIFEEGWSEIDHTVRYPYDIDNSILSDYLVIFNRLAGSADEMGSYVRFLSRELKRMQYSHQEELEEKNTLIQELKDTISDLEIEKQAKEELQRKLNILETRILPSQSKDKRPERVSVDDLFFKEDRDSEEWVETPDISLPNGGQIKSKQSR